MNGSGVKFLASIYKPRRRRHGKLVIARFYRLRWKWTGELRYHDLALKVGDRQVAERKLAEFKAEREQERWGILPPRPLREAAARPMTDHLADFVAELRRLGRSDKYLENTENRLDRLITDCQWKLPKDITGESFMAWRRGQTLKSKTINQFFDHASALLNWMKQQGRILQNPLLGVVRKVSVVSDESPWRALSDDEVRRLLSKAANRRAIYIVALSTGLRRSELAALEWRDVHLDAVRPFLSVRASTTKNGKAAQLWLRDDVVAELVSLPGDHLATTPVFSALPTMEEFRADLAAAEIPEVDATGRSVVFHSLRHTLATQLARAQVPPRVAMELMRHSDLRLTMKVYTDSALLPTSDALDNLPWYGDIAGEAVAQATGTDHVVARDAQKDTQKVGRTCPVATGPVTVLSHAAQGKPAENKRDCPDLSGRGRTTADTASSSAGRTRIYRKSGVAIAPVAVDTQNHTQSGEIDPDLMIVIGAWPKLGVELRAGVLAIVRAGGLV